MFAQVRVGNFVGLRPDIEVSGSKNKRNEKYRHQGNRTHGRALDAPDNHAPTAFGEMAKHKNHHGTERDSEPIHEADEVSAEENSRLEKTPDYDNDRCDYAGDQKTALVHPDDGRRQQVFGLPEQGAHCDGSLP